MKPIIGIVSNFDVEKDGYFLFAHYVRAIQKAGGLPVILPYVNADEVGTVLDVVSGVVLTGGGDFPPELYGAEPNPAVARMIPARDAFEIPLARTALERDMPILGICRGMQLLNVLEGGTIYPHTLDELDGAMDHRNGTPLNESVHDVQLDTGSRLWQLCGRPSSPFRVNSFHHQAVKQLAPGFVASAHAEDGVIEAIEAPARRFLIGVQWHPEWMYDTDTACRNLIDNFTKACATRG